MNVGDLVAFRPANFSSFREEFPANNESIKYGIIVSVGDLDNGYSQVIEVYSNDQENFFFARELFLV